MGGSDGADAGAARLAWRAADEWRRLAEAREELNRTREELVRHQAMLVQVGDSVRTQFIEMEQKVAQIDAKQSNLGDIQMRLDQTRGELGQQYAQQQKWLISQKDQLQPTGVNNSGGAARGGALGSPGRPRSPRTGADKSLTPREQAALGRQQRQPGGAPTEATNELAKI